MLKSSHGLIRMTNPIVAPTVTWNPADTSPNIVFSNGNLTTAGNSTADGGVRATLKLITTGKRYYETVFTITSGGDNGGGFCTPTATLNDIGNGVHNAVMQFHSGNVYRNAAVQFANGGLSNGSVLKMCYDAAAHLVWFKADTGNWNANGSADPGTGVGGLDISSIDSAGLFPAWSTGIASGDTATGRFKAADFTGTIPSGFSSWSGG